MVNVKRWPLKWYLVHFGGGMESDPASYCSMAKAHKMS